jgi:hypothetical protein
LAKGFEPHATYFLPLVEMKAKSFTLDFQKNVLPWFGVSPTTLSKSTTFPCFL